MLSENVGLWLEEVLSISALAIGFEAVRGPTHVLEAEEVAVVLQDASANGSLKPEGADEISKLLEAEELGGMIDRIRNVRRHITGVLTDPVYVNDDKDREIILTQIALCRELERLRRTDGQLPTRQLQKIWDRFGGDNLV